MPSTPPAPVRPPRLPRPAVEPRARGRELRTGALAGLGLLAVLVGVPVALALTIGNPLPTTAPSRAWLDTQVSSTVVLKVLAALLWLVWAHFAVCVLTELRAARRGSGLPGEVPLGGGSQLLARRLVAGVLLLAGAAALAPQAATTSAPERSTSSLSIATEAAAPAAEAAPETAEAPAQAPEATGTKTYVVQPPDGRRYDSLWDISERTLGDPLRYKEVFELNKDRVQADGRRLVEADLIHPGWVLLMPADASGPGISVAATPPPATPAPVPAQAPPGSPVAEAPDAAPQAQSGTTLEQALLGGGLLAAGLLVALSARRGPYGPPSAAGAEERLRLAADTERAALLDVRLRELAADCAAHGRPLPEVALAYVGARDVVLHLSRGGATAPEGWEASADGRVLTVVLAEGEALPAAPRVAAPYPALVNVATVGDHEVLVDLEVAPGLVSLVGERARDAAVSLAVEVATNGWSDGVAVTLVGFGDDLADVAPGSLTTASLLADVLPGVRSELADGEAALRRLGVDGVLSGRLARGAEHTRPRVLVLSGPPSPEDAAALAEVVRRGRTPLAVVVVGDAAGTGWRFSLEPGGRIDLGVFGVTGTARLLGQQAYGQVLALLRDADATRREAGAQVAALTPRGAVELLGPEPTSPAPAGAAPAPWALLPALPGVPSALVARTAPGVTVGLLGPVQVQAPGPLDEAARPLLTEVVVAVALHREGLHAQLLRALVWPRGVDDGVVAETVAAAQAWLGTAPDGLPRLRLSADGRYLLADDVHADVDALRTAATVASGPDELAVLRAALAPVRGEAFSAVPAGRYRWLRFHAAASETRTTASAVARRAAELAAAGGDPGGAQALLRTGLRLVPLAEAVWRDLLRLTPPDGTPGVVADLEAALADGRVRAEPQTDALVQQLLPGHGARTA